MLLGFSHHELYQKLNVLVKNNSAVFSYTDTNIDGSIYRIFSYSSADYKSFLADGAIECRGITFFIDEQENFLSLISLPMEKFFNYNENPFTQNIGEETVSIATYKEDGSLISTYLHNGKVHLKSKGSFFSEQAIAANELLLTFPELKQRLQHYEELGYTVNIEYTAPDNQVVLVQEKQNLIILNIRSRKDGSYLSYDDILAPKEHMVSVLSEYHNMTLKDFSVLMSGLKNLEGAVVLTNKNKRIKFKTDWYCQKHNTFNYYSPWGRKGRREIMNAILNQTIDDTKQLFVNNKQMSFILNSVESFTIEYIQELTNEITLFCQENSDLDSYSFFKKCTSTFKDDNIKFTCAMRTYNGTLKSILEQIYIATQSSKFYKYNKFLENLNIGYNEDD